ncbi:MAG: hypothetical protein J0H06_09615 [Actinobacteria bacterium]|nr:hypothetical protein [Actinomycetota bacterium]
MASGAFDTHGEAVLASLLAGASVADAATRHGVAARTIERWLAKGRNSPDGEYGDFSAAVDARRADRDLPTEPMSAEEFRQAIDGAVRSGSVSAMKLWAELFLDPGEEEPEGAGSTIASLAQRRKGIR